MYCPDCGKQMSTIMGMRPPDKERQEMGDFCIDCLVYIEKESSDESREAIRAVKCPDE